MAARPPWLRVIDGGKGLDVPPSQNIVRALDMLERARMMFFEHSALHNKPQPNLVPVHVVRRQRTMETLSMSYVNHPAISAIIKVLADAVNDTDNALGSGKKPMFLLSYGNLFVDILKVCGNLSHLPTEIRLLSQEDAGPIVAELTSQLNMSSTHAQAIVDAGSRLLQQFLNATLGSVEGMAAAIKDADAAKALAQAKPQK